MVKKSQKRSKIRFIIALSRIINIALLCTSIASILSCTDHDAGFSVPCYEKTCIMIPPFCCFSWYSVFRLRKSSTWWLIELSVQSTVLWCFSWSLVVCSMACGLLRVCCSNASQVARRRVKR